MSGRPTILRVLHVNGHGEPPGPVWVESGDVEAHDGRGTVDYTTDRARALVFPTGGAALAWWRTQSTVRPFREDGLPNRPFCALTIETEDA